MTSESMRERPARRLPWLRRLRRSWRRLPWLRRLRRSWRRLSIWVRVPVILVLAYLLVAALVWATQRPTDIERTADECSAVLQVGDEGHTLSLHVAEKPGDNVFAWVDFDKFRCITGELEVPSYVITHIQQTRALDGMQTDSWDDMSARWTYHPDAGLNITIRED